MNSALYSGWVRHRRHRHRAHAFTSSLYLLLLDLDELPQALELPPFASVRGFAPIREDWLARAARIGRDVTARTGSRQVSGRFETVDAAGNLVLATQAGRVAIAAADVFF